MSTYSPDAFLVVFAVDDEPSLDQADRSQHMYMFLFKYQLSIHSFIHHISPLKVNISKIRLLYVIDLKHERRFNLNWIYVMSSPRILRYIRPELGGRPCILVANKTDLVRNRVVRTAGEKNITSGRQGGESGWLLFLWWPLRLSSQPLSSNDCEPNNYTMLLCYGVSIELRTWKPNS